LFTGVSVTVAGSAGPLSERACEVPGPGPTFGLSLPSLHALANNSVVAAIKATPARRVVRDFTRSPVVGIGCVT